MQSVHQWRLGSHVYLGHQIEKNHKLYYFKKIFISLTPLSRRRLSLFSSEVQNNQDTRQINFVLKGLLLNASLTNSLRFNNFATLVVIT